MHTLETYDEDKSALGRFSAWWVAWRLAFDYPLGVGFNAARPELFALYSPYPEFGTPAAHSIYFQILGNHGFVGLFLFICILVSILVTANKVRKLSKGIPEAQWASDLAGMCQTSLLGYAIGGAFLSLAYFDLPYYLLVLVVLCNQWVQRKGWIVDPPYVPGSIPIPGMGMDSRPQASATGKAGAVGT